MNEFLTEDKVRDDIAKLTLGFNDNEENITQGTGQLTKFNQLGFKGAGKLQAPDGWYLPENFSMPAIILEAKNSDIDISRKDCTDELIQNINVVLTKYKIVIGILYNGYSIRVFKNHNEITEQVSSKLEHKKYYIKLCTDTSIDIKSIKDITMRINNNLHFKFGMQSLQDRMIFTACALVAQRYNPVNGLQKIKDLGYTTFHNWISEAISKAIEKDKRENEKLNILLEEYAAVRISITENQESINDFIDDVCAIADLVNSDYWHGEDVMGIFFNEFNRYRGKSDAGQVFTPDHVTSFMYRLIGITKNDYVFDGTCGSGAFLVKAMGNMIKEAGGVSTAKAAEIKKNQLFGIEMYRKVFALACANMMIHKDGKTNLAQMDCSSQEAADWIKSKHITKVLMNPPYERKYGCIKIVGNVLDSVPVGTKCAFIMPDKKLEKDGGKKLLKNHFLSMIIKMPENLFFGIGVTTSIYVFTAGEPQKDRKIIGYYIEDDGLETVKNQGRQDIKHKWSDELEDYWIGAITDQTSEFFGDTKHHTRQIIDPKEHLSYQMPEKPFEISEEDFMKTAMDYLMFKRGIDVKDFKENLLNSVMYSSEVDEKNGAIKIASKSEKKNEIRIDTWREFTLRELFGDCHRGRRLKRSDRVDGTMPLATAGFENNGIASYINNPEMEVFENCLSIDMFGNCFYRDYKYNADDNILSFGKDGISKGCYEFISTVINHDRKNFDFKFQYRQNNYERHVIKLPATPDGAPDWQFMEAFMKKIEAKARKQLGMRNEK